MADETEEILEYPQDPEAQQDIADMGPPAAVEQPEGTEQPEEEEARPLNEEPFGLALLNIIQEDNRQQMFVRESNMRKWRKHHLYWDNMQYLAWSEVAHDWMTAEDMLEENPQADIDPALYAKVVNVYKAHGEILIGALSSGLPAVRFFPKDADDHEDVMAAKARSKIAELIQRQNHARLLLMKALFLMYNEGVVFAYNENKTDYRFGTISEPEYEDVIMTNRNYYCPSCGFDFGAENFQPDGYPEPEGPQMSEQECPQCGQLVTPDSEDGQESQQIQKGVQKKPKNRECLEFYGPLNVQIPMWCREQQSVPILNLKTEESVFMVKEVYPEFADRITATSYPDTYEKEMRVPGHYKNDFPADICTVERVWVREWAFNYYRRDDERFNLLRQKFPEGAYCVIINGDLMVEAIPDKLDDHWTVSEHPLAQTLHAEPIGSAMVPLQDITNELANITLETIEFGIPEIFAASNVLDFDAYSKVEARPGQITEANMPAGQGLSAGFHEVKASTLSREVEMFASRVEQMAQFVMGSYPSVYGGAQDGGSGTAREYELSKASALQRLSNTWLILQEFYAKVMGKAVSSYVKNQREDEKFVTQKGTNFLNVWIRKAELSGEVGDVEPEISETFPISWAQKRDVILNLIQMQNEDLMTVIRHPENAGLVATIIGVPELYIPGDDDRNKQLAEIALLIQMEPQEVPPSAFNQSGLLSSVPIEPELDNHSIEAEICRSWLKSEVGQDAKENNAAGYANVLAHLREHLFFETQQQMQMQSMEAPAEETMTAEGVADESQV